MIKVVNRNLDGKWQNIGFGEVYVEAAKKIAIEEFIKNKEKVDAIAAIQAQAGKPLTANEKEILLDNLTTPYVYILEDMASVIIENPEHFNRQNFDQLHNENVIAEIKEKVMSVFKSKEK